MYRIMITMNATFAFFSSFSTVQPRKIQSQSIRSLFHDAKIDGSPLFAVNSVVFRYLMEQARRKGRIIVSAEELHNGNGEHLLVRVRRERNPLPTKSPLEQEKERERDREKRRSAGRAKQSWGTRWREKCTSVANESQDD